MQTFGVMYTRFGVFAADVRSPGSAVSATSLVLQAGVSMIEWKYTNGLWRVAYMSVLVGTIVGSFAPIAGCRQVFGCVAEFPMSSM